VKQQRVEELMLAQQQVAFAKARSMVGQTIEVLIDRPDPSGLPASAGRWIARSQSQAPDIDSVVYVNGAELHRGQFVTVRVVDYQAYDLVAELSRQRVSKLKVLAG
jgi:ribosomal protein S12 methylthiotransferase